MLIQAAAHRPDLVAKLNAIEFPILIGIEILLIRWRGIEGAAIAWSVRLALEAVAYWIMTLWMLPESSSIAMRTAAGVAATVVPVAVGVFLPFSLVGQVLFLLITLSAGSVAGWSYLLTREDKGRDWPSGFQSCLCRDPHEGAMNQSVVAGTSFGRTKGLSLMSDEGSV